MESIPSRLMMKRLSLKRLSNLIQSESEDALARAGIDEAASMAAISVFFIIFFMSVLFLPSYFLRYFLPFLIYIPLERLLPLVATFLPDRSKMVLADADCALVTVVSSIPSGISSSLTSNRISVMFFVRMEFPFRMIRPVSKFHVGPFHSSAFQSAVSMSAPLEREAVMYSTFVLVVWANIAPGTSIKSSVIFFIVIRFTVSYYCKINIFYYLLQII